MRMSFLVAVVVLFLASTVEGRTWTSSKGTTMEADYVGHKDGKILLFEKSNSKILAIEPGDLSAEDQRHAANLEDCATSDRLSKQVAGDPTNSTHFVSRGRAYLNLRKPEEALTDFNIAIALDERSAEAFDGRGLAYNKLGESAKAHIDFTKAIHLDETYPLAYRHRAENLLEYIKTPEGIPVYEKAKAEFEKKRAHLAKTSRDDVPWQLPIDTRSKDFPARVMQAYIDADMELYRMFNILVSGESNAGDILLPGPFIPLGVYPPVVEQGDPVTLQANPSELAKGMPNHMGPGTKGPGGKKRASVVVVDFYRDANANGIFNANQDEYLGTDKDGEGGFSLKVSTASFPVGNQTYFAVPKDATTGSEVKKGDPSKPGNPFTGRAAAANGLVKLPRRNSDLDDSGLDRQTIDKDGAGRK